MPLLAGGRRITHPGYRRPFAFFELPKNQIVFEAVRTKCEVVAIWLQIEQYAGTLIDAARQSFEAHGDLAASEIFYVLGDGVRVVGIGLNPVKKLGVALTVERSRLVCDSGGGLPFFPLAPIDRQNVLPAFAFDPPDADDGH